MPSPRSTLFPYTTLFRSRVWAHALSGRSARRSSGRRSSAWTVSRSLGVSFQRPASPVEVRQETTGRQPCGRRPWGGKLTRPSEDRKSTRLNSSHSQTSYAVTALYTLSLHDALPISRVGARVEREVSEAVVREAFVGLDRVEVARRVVSAASFPG